MDTPTDPEILARNLRSVNDRLRAACTRAGRAISDVTLVAVTKNHPPEDVEALYQIGVTEIGENRIQEALPKGEAVSAPVSWHMIGHLQRNKARKALGLFSVFHSVESLSLAKVLDRVMSEDLPTSPASPLKIFVQVNVSGETRKSGLSPEEAEPFLAEVKERYPHIHPVGLMTMAPFEADPESARPHFAALRNLATKASEKSLLPDRPGLSMGMTNDFEVAVEEGATHIRVGSALFASP